MLLLERGKSPRRMNAVDEIPIRTSLPNQRPRDDKLPFIVCARFCISARCECACIARAFLITSEEIQLAIGSVFPELAGALRSQAPRLNAGGAVFVPCR
jgi:hypothetical protein